MNKEHFLIELKIYLKPLPVQDQEPIIQKYETFFEERMTQGETEEVIAKSLGKPKQIAENILKEFDMPLKEKQLTQESWQEIPAATENWEEPLRKERNFLTMAFILCIDVFFMTWFVPFVCSMLIGGWLTAIALLLSPIILGFLSLISLFSTSFFTFYVLLSLFLFGSGIIGCLILHPLTKLCIYLAKQYINWHVAAFRKES